jgi:hypothetical protein
VISFFHNAEIQPSYEWAPWVCPHNISGRFVFNTEVQKCPTFKETKKEAVDDEDDDEEKALTEEFLIELLAESSVNTFIFHSKMDIL